MSDLSREHDHEIALPKTLRLLDNGLDISDDASDDDLIAAGNQLWKVKDVAQFGIGDLYNKVKTRASLDVTDVFGGNYTFDSLKNMGSVAWRYKRDERWINRGLSYSHHTDVVWVDKDIREKLLSAALPLKGQKKPNIKRDEFREFRDQLVRQCKNRVNGERCYGTMTKMPNEDGEARWVCRKCEHDEPVKEPVRKTVTIKDALLTLSDGQIVLDVTIPKALVPFHGKKVKAVFTMTLVEEAA